MNYLCLRRKNFIMSIESSMLVYETYEIDFVVLGTILKYLDIKWSKKKT